MTKFSKKVNGSKTSLTQVNLHAMPVSPVTVTQQLNPVNTGAAPTLPILANVNLVVNNASSALDSYGIPKLPILGNMAAANMPPAVAAVISNPIQLKEWGDPNTAQDQINTDSISTPNNQKTFSIYTGLLDTEPTILLSSEFQPLYDSGNKTNQGSALALKEKAKLLTAKTSINLLSQNADATQLLQENKNAVRQHAQLNSDLSSQLLKSTNNLLAYMDLSSYAIPVQRNPSSVGSLYEILKKSGYNTSYITNYTETKLWQQSLLELKRNLTAHTQALISQNFNRSGIQTDVDAFELSDVTTFPIGYKKIWMNPAHPALPSPAELTNPETLSNSLVAFSEFDKKKYVNLAAGNSSINSQLPGDVIDSLVQTGKDICVSINAVTKELSYSYAISKQDYVNLLSTKYGYTTSTSGDNFRVWDHVIGRFPGKITDFIATPTGNGNSLVSFSQRAITAPDASGVLNVLTFENNSFPDAAITPGSVYYVDSTLGSIGAGTFDTSRLDSLANITKSAHETTKTIFDLLGYEILPTILPVEGTNEYYEKKHFPFDVKAESITDKLSSVAELYRSCIDINDNQFVKLNTNALVAGFKLTTNDTVGVRLASLICKLAVYPTAGYVKVASRLKTLLFLWLMNVVIKMSDSTINNDSVIIEAKKRIASYVGSVRTSVNNNEVEKAMWTARTLLVTSDLESTITAEQTETNSVVRERKAASSSYVQAIFNKIFQVDSNKGIWKIIADLLKSVYENPDLYVNGNTAYSGLSKTAFLYNYFDMLLRVVAAQTPENIMGMYSVVTPRQGSSIRNSSGNIVDTGILISEVTKQQLDEYYSVIQVLSGKSPRNYTNKLNDAISVINVENNTIVRQIAFFRKYFSDLGLQLNIFGNYLRDNLSAQFVPTKDLYFADASLSDNQKSALLNLSLSEEQLRLSRYIASEMIDRIDSSIDTESKLKSLPAFADLQSGFMDYMPIDEMDLVSYSALSPYFKSNEFLSEKGNNKRILSIGIPPRLIRSIHSMSRSSSNISKSIKQGIIRIKIYKLDRLHPDAVFLPKSYIFEMHRYPTRRLSNWSILDDVNVLAAPSKLVLPDGQVVTHKNFNEAFPSNYYESILTEQEKYQVYSNHTVSFLCEEYLRWFTDCKFDESRYNNFSELTRQLELVTDQYNSFINAVRPVSSPASTATTNSSASEVMAAFTDSNTNEVFVIPTSSPKNENPRNEKPVEKTYVLPLDSTIRSYFMNETFMLKPEVLKRRISYFKKFDRVFNVIIDPDDFYVDTALTSESTLKSMKQLGILSGGEDQAKGTVQPYKHRDTGPNDIFFNEYFVTIEPYDYVQEEV